MGQGSVLSPILSTLYISPVFHILEKHLKNLNISAFVLSFVNDGLFIVQSKSLTISNSLLFCSYNVVSSLLEKFDLILEHKKMEVFHFSRSYGVFNSPPLNLSEIGSLSLISRDT